MHALCFFTSERVSFRGYTSMSARPHLHRSPQFDLFSCFRTLQMVIDSDTASGAWAIAIRADEPLSPRSAAKY